jgi:hypothetical protein
LTGLGWPAFSLDPSDAAASYGGFLEQSGKTPKIVLPSSSWLVVSLDPVGPCRKKVLDHDHLLENGRVEADAGYTLLTGDVILVRPDECFMALIGFRGGDGSVMPPSL